MEQIMSYILITNVAQEYMKIINSTLRYTHSLCPWPIKAEMGPAQGLIFDIQLFLSSNKSKVTCRSEVSFRVYSLNGCGDCRQAAGVANQKHNAGVAGQECRAGATERVGRRTGAERQPWQRKARVVLLTSLLGSLVIFLSPSFPCLALHSWLM